MARQPLLFFIALLFWSSTMAQSSTFDPALAATLDSIKELDQELRVHVKEIRKEFGPSSKELLALWVKIEAQDSVNQRLVADILEKRGWLGVEEVGEEGSSTISLVILHAPLPFQQRYLAMMRDAVKQGKATKEYLAYMEDKMASIQGLPQTYGSQLGVDKESGIYFLRPVIDPDHLDDRRASMGMGPIADYVGIFGIVWDLAAYKKDMPRIQKILDDQEKEQASSEH